MGSSRAIFGARSLQPKIPFPAPRVFSGKRGFFLGSEIGDPVRAKSAFRVAIIAGSIRAPRTAGAIRRTTSAPPGQTSGRARPQNPPRRLQVTRSNAPIQHQSQSFLSNIVALISSRAFGSSNPTLSAIQAEKSHPRDLSARAATFRNGIANALNPDNAGSSERQAVHVIIGGYARCAAFGLTGKGDNGCPTVALPSTSIPMTIKGWFERDGSISCWPTL